MIGVQAVVADRPGRRPARRSASAWLQELRLGTGPPGVSIVATAEGIALAPGLRARRRTRTSSAACWPSASCSSRAAQGDRRRRGSIADGVFGRASRSLFLTFSRAAWIGVRGRAGRRRRHAGDPSRRPGVRPLGRGGAHGRRHRRSSWPSRSRRTWPRGRRLAGPVPTESRSIDERLALATSGCAVFADSPAPGHRARDHARCLVDDRPGLRRTPSSRPTSSLLDVGRRDRARRRRCATSS